MTEGRIPTFENFLPVLQDIVAGKVNDVRDLVRSAAPVGKGSEDRAPGTYRDGIDAEYSATGDGAEIRVMGPEPLSTWIRAGTQPHVIVPRHQTQRGRLGYLRFEVGGGGVVYTQHVDHPGTSANAFEEAVLPDIADLAAEAVALAVAASVNA